MTTRSRVAVLVTLLSVLGACTAGPSNRPEIVVNQGGGGSPSTPQTATTEVPPLEELDSDIEWKECSEEVRASLAEQPPPGWLPIDCGRINSVLDSPYAPGRGVARLQLLRAGTGPVPVVVVNDVSGLPGTVYAARLAASLPQSFFADFTLIGIDRRGTGNSAAPNCVPGDIRRDLVEPDPAALNVSSWLKAAQTAGQQCAILLEDQLPALDTWRSAADLETLREELGISRLNAIGHGEGSRVVSVYADRFPGRVGRLVLDGVPDPTTDAATILEGVAKGTEAAFDAFAADCVRRACELGGDPEQALTTLLEQLRDNPLPGEVRITAGSALHAVVTALSDKAKWPALSRALAAAGGGEPSLLADLLAPVVLGSEVQAPTMDAALVIGCNDTETRLTPEQITTTAGEWNSLYPLFGGLTAQRLANCGPWTRPDAPLDTPTARGAPPILVIGTASDAVTPLEGTERGARQLSSGVFISWQGGGHGALGHSPCATNAMAAFMKDAAIPQDGTVCPP
jgi:pimeloyl-ACP methyl ester carboxylesterase